MPLQEDCYKINYVAAKLIFTKNCRLSVGDSLLIFYKTFPIAFAQHYKNRDRVLLKQKYGGQYNPLKYEESGRNSNSVFNFEGLSKSGSISRGLSFGNNQDVIVNSSLNLQLSGTLSDRVEILAAISDNNIPIQPEGNTQQLQEFDKVFIQLSRDSSKLIAGDFELIRPPGYFMALNKKAQGGLFSSAITLDEKKNWLLRTTNVAAISKGKFARLQFNGTEANQGPYRLTGTEGELYIIVLSGTEKIYLNGQLLIRGKENDYIIDYNTAQLTFTPRRLMTKDARIVAEFQYSDKNYVRTLIHTANIVENKRTKIRLNYFSEQDNKNQPLFQDLDEEKRKVLANAGDGLQEAFFLNVDSVGFNRNEVLYKRDTVIVNGIPYTIYRYSTDSTLAYYRLGFALVGLGNGNYKLINSNANGKVYEWITPVNGIPQGDYEPVKLLASPKKQQLFTVGSDFLISRNTFATVEGAYSKNDINLFSKKDKANDVGYAIAGSITQVIPLHLTDTSWRNTTVVGIEYTDKNFKPLENYRSVEFTRDWNLQGTTDTSSERIISFKTGIDNSKKQGVFYTLKSFERGLYYKGLLNGIDLRYSVQKYFLNYAGSILFTSGKLRKSTFIRSYADGGRQFKKFKLGMRQENERNKIFLPGADSLLTASFGHDKASMYIASPDTGKIAFSSEVFRRYDYNVMEQQLALATTADQVNADVSLAPGRGNKVTLGTTYRTLKINRQEITAQKKDESFVSRADIGFVFLKGGLTSRTYYELGAGQEQKQVYAFIKVAAGTGVYEWNDYNNNSIQELNEFEIANFSDRAEYIKIYSPTNEFIKTQTNQLSEVVSLNPSAFIKNKQGHTRFINRLAIQCAARFDNKRLAGKLTDALNPFKNNIADTTLVITNSSFRNTLFFNRSNSAFAADLNYEDTKNKSLLANGAEARFLQTWQLNTRSYIKRIYGLNFIFKYGNKENQSVFLNRNYNIRFYESEPRISIQPGTVFRTTIIYKLQLKNNQYGEALEKATIQTFGTEVKYSSFKNGVLSAAFNFIQINYNADENSPLSFEMLEGLRNGKNLTWELGIQRNISGNLQINVTYNGRKPQSEKTIHTANVQVRANF